MAQVGLGTYRGKVPFMHESSFFTARVFSRQFLFTAHVFSRLIFLRHMFFFTAHVFMAQFFHALFLLPAKLGSTVNRGNFGQCGVTPDTF